MSTTERKWPLFEEPDEEEEDLDEEDSATSTAAAAAAVVSAFAVPGARADALLLAAAPPDERGDGPGDGTVFASADTEYNAEEVIKGLKDAGLVPANQVDALRTAIQSLQGNDAAHAQKTLATLAGLAAGNSGIPAAQAKQLIELAILKGQNPDLQTDTTRLSEAGNVRELDKTVELAKRLAAIDEMAKSGIDGATIERLKSAVKMQLAHPSSEARLTEFNKVIEKVTSAEFLKRPDAKARLGHYAELLSINNSHLRIPFEKLLSDKISTENLKFVVDRFKESGRSPFRPPVDRAPGLGTTFEYNCSRTAMDAYHSQGSGWVFIPAANGSQADKQGIDGMLVNPETGELKFIDWTKDMPRKYAEGKAEWAMTPDSRNVHDYANNPTPPNQRLLQDFGADVELGLRGDAAGRQQGHEVPSTKISSFEKVQPPSFAENPAESGAQAAKRFIDSVDKNAERVNDPTTRRGWRYADPVIEHMEQRARNAYGNLLGEQTLATRLARPIAQLAELQVRGRRPGDVGFDASRLRIQTDNRQLNEITRKPMKFIELPVNMDVSGARLPRESFNRGGTIVSMRLYEDGSIRGTMEVTNDRGVTTRQSVELGHVSELVPQMRREVTRGISDGPTRAAADAMLDRLTEVNANKPLNFQKESALVEAFGVAATQSERVMEVHRQSRNIDDVKAKLKRFGIDVDDSEAARLAERVGDPTKVNAEKMRKAYESSQLELNMQLDRAKADQIVDLQEKFEKAGTPADLAREAAIISVTRGVPEAQAVDIAKITVELNKLDHSAPKNRVLELAAKIRGAAPNVEAAVKMAQDITVEAKKLATDKGMSPTAAMDAAVLKAVDKVAEAKAVQIASDLEKFRKADPNLSLADGLKAVEAGEKLPTLDKPIVEKMKGAVETALKANPADLRAAWSALRQFAETEWEKQGKGEGSWLEIHELLGKNFDEAKFRQSLGLPATGNLTPSQISEAMLKTMAEKSGLSPTLARGYATDAMGFLNPGTNQPAPAAELNDAQKRAMDIAKGLKEKQAGLRLERPAQIKQLLNSALDAIDESSTRWAEADRQAFVDLIDKYAKGDPAAIKTVHGMLGLPVPAEVAALPGSGESTGDRPAPESVSLRDLQRDMQDPVKRVEVVARLMERGPIRETLMKAGVPEDKARRLERDLLSEREEVRKRAQREVARVYEGRGGLRGFGMECKGRLGAMVLVASALLPFIFAGSSSSDDGGGDATWRGG